ncbi:hypothetical protein V1264_017511 [Littorina saxatilis]|uniref:Uncharacterized protein n=1 Tax=Littorina saxatilis TaxID=31220 RepID=A0AAN9GGT5_9CAEN
MNYAYAYAVNIWDQQQQQEIRRLEAIVRSQEAIQLIRNAKGEHSRGTQTTKRVVGVGPMKNRLLDLKPSARGIRKKDIEQGFRDLIYIFAPDCKEVAVAITFSDGTSSCVNQPANAEPIDTDSYATCQKTGRKRTAYELSVLDLAVYTRLKHQISEKSLHEMRMSGLASFPSLDVLRTYQYQKYLIQHMELDIIPIQYTDAASSSVTARGVMRKVEQVLGKALRTAKNEALLQQETKLTLRFSRDGAKLSKNMTAVTGTFKIITPRHLLTEETAQSC